MNDYNADAKLLFLIDRIEDSSYPVTETGYALVYRAWMRALSGSGEIYVASPTPRARCVVTRWSRARSTTSRI